MPAFLGGSRAAAYAIAALVIASPAAARGDVLEDVQVPAAAQPWVFPNPGGVPVYPGSLVVNHSDASPGWARCTVGFGVVDPDGRRGFVTAAHCYRGDPSNTVSLAGFDGPGSPIGVYTPGPDPSSSTDMAFVAVNAGVPADPAVGGSLPFRAASPTEIAEFGAAGGQLCKFGSTTGLTCGPLVSVDDHHLVFRAWDDLGDSGAPVFFRDSQGQLVAAGILHGHEDDEQGRTISATLLGPVLEQWRMSLIPS